MRAAFVERWPHPPLGCCSASSSSHGLPSEADAFWVQRGPITPAESQIRSLEPARTETGVIEMARIEIRNRGFISPLSAGFTSSDFEPATSSNPSMSLSAVTLMGVLLSERAP
jgi:hypothetical protein